MESSVGYAGIRLNQAAQPVCLVGRNVGKSAAKHRGRKHGQCAELELSKMQTLFWPGR